MKKDIKVNNIFKTIVKYLVIYIITIFYKKSNKCIQYSYLVMTLDF